MKTDLNSINQTIEQIDHDYARIAPKAVIDLVSEQGTRTGHTAYEHEAFHELASSLRRGTFKAVFFGTLLAAASVTAVLAFSDLTHAANKLYTTLGGK